MMLRYEGTLRYGDLLLFIESSVGSVSGIKMSVFDRLCYSPIRWFYDALIFGQVFRFYRLAQILHEFFDFYLCIQ